MPFKCFPNMQCNARLMKYLLGLTDYSVFWKSFKMVFAVYFEDIPCGELGKGGWSVKIMLRII